MSCCAMAWAIHWADGQHVFRIRKVHRGTQDVGTDHCCLAQLGTDLLDSLYVMHKGKRQKQIWSLGALGNRRD